MVLYRRRTSASWRRGASLATALVALPSSAFAEDLSVTITETAINAYAAAVGPIEGAGTYDLTFETFRPVCLAEQGGMCFRFGFDTVERTQPLDWSWELQSATFDVTAGGITFHGIVKVTFDGEESLLSVERNGVVFYHAGTDAVVLLLDFLSETKVPIYAARYGETHLLGTISPFQYFNAMIPVGVANATFKGKKVSGDPTNVQINLQNDQLRIESDVQFSG